ncbi:MAG: hypothetical protein ACK47B_24860 [Armatimonadota bacterium]
MEHGSLQSAAEETSELLASYFRERVLPHPLLAPVLPEAAVCVTGSVALGVWDERSDFNLRWILPDEEHAALAARLEQEGLWEPASDSRLRIVDREPFRRYPGVELLLLSQSQVRQELRFDLPVSLWVYTHSEVYQDPHQTLAALVAEAEERFQRDLGNLRCEHYYRFRQARSGLISPIMPRRLNTVLAMKRGDAVREALRLAFLADGKPYPYDKWLEVAAERETQCGSGIVTAVRALIAAREPESIERAGKVLRDRVAFALQQGGVSEPWLEQWWLWPSIAP